MLADCLMSLSRFFEDVVVIDNTTNGNVYREQAPWGLGLVPRNQPYVVCDEDIEIDRDCPDDLVQCLLDASEIFPKVGLQIRTDDVPEVPRYAYSLRWERSLNSRRCISTTILPAEVDTHFAIYRQPFNPGICGVRLAAPYQCRHLPWYHLEFTDEEIDYYRRTGSEWARTHSAGELCES